MKGRNHRYVGRQPGGHDWYDAPALRPPRRVMTPEQVARALRLHADELPAADQHIAVKLRERAERLEQEAS